MFEFYFEYLRATGDTVQVVTEVHYEDSLHPDTDALQTNIFGLDILAVTDEGGEELELAPWELEDARMQAEEQACKALFSSRRASLSRWQC